MMELTRLYEPECRIALKKVSVETLFATVKESVSHRLQEKNMILQMEGEFQDRNKMLDSDLMTSFLINLVNNSIMASEPESTIYLGADEHSLWVQTGLASLLSLLVFYALFLKRCFTYYRSCPLGSAREKLGFGCFLACVCYLVCCLFCDSSLFTTPVFYVFAGVALAAARQE